MKKIINVMSIFALLSTSFCGQQNQVAEGAVDSETVVVNRVQELQGENGETQYYGEVGIVHGATSQQELNQMVENDQVEFMSEEELEASGITLVEDATETSNMQEVVFWPFALAFGLIVGLAAGEASADYNHKVYHRNRRVHRRGHHTYNSHSTYYPRNHRRHRSKVKYHSTYWY